MALSINSPADITVTEEQAVNVGWVASGGGVSPVSFVNKPTGSTSFEIIPSITSYNGVVSVGCGNSKGADAKVLVSSDGGDNWTTLINSPADLSSCYTNEYDHNGVLWSFLSDDTATETTGKIRIYRNGILYSTTDIPATDAWAFCCFPNGNYSLGVAGNAVGSITRFYKFTDGTQPVQVLQQASSKGRPCNIVKINDTTAISADLGGFVYKTTDSGDSWNKIAELGTNASVTVLAILPSGGIVASIFGQSTWKISEDGGVTWSTWVNKPTKYAYSRINNRNGLLIFGSITDRSVCLLRNNVWEYYLIPDAIIDRVYQADIINGDMYAVTGNATGDGRVYKSPLLPVYSATTTKNGSPYSTAMNTTGLFPLNIPTAQVSDSGTYAITVTNGGSSVSDSVGVTVEAMELWSTTPDQDITITENSSVYFKCGVTSSPGSPPITFTLYRDNTPLYTSTIPSVPFSPTYCDVVVPNYTVDLSGLDHYWVIEQNGYSIQSAPITVTVLALEQTPYVPYVIPEGDPKLVFDPDGVDLIFANGLPEMDNAFENIVNIQYGTDSDTPLNRFVANDEERIGSDLSKELAKSITRDQMEIVERTAEQSLASLVASGLFKSVKARMNYISTEGYRLELTIEPPTGETKILSFVRYGENWLTRQLLP